MPKRLRSQDKPVPPTTHSVALKNIRDVTVAFGAEYGALLVPVERRITHYLRQQRLYIVGGINSDGVLCSCYSLDVVAGVWVQEAPMTKERKGFGLCVHRGDLLTVGGSNVLSSNQRCIPILRTP